MNYGSFRNYRYAYVLMVAAVALALTASELLAKPAMLKAARKNGEGGGAVILTTPTAGATVSGSVTIAVNVSSAVVWVNYYIDGGYLASSPPYTTSWDSTSVSNGSHTVSVKAFATSGGAIGSASVTVAVKNTGTASGAPGSGSSIASLTGSASGIAGADTNPANYGKYSASGGQGLIGGPLLTDAQAASFVVPTQQSSIETGPNGPANAAANNYFNYIAANNASDYLNQLKAGDGFYAGYVGSSWQAAANRIDGACSMVNPTTAEVLQWAANKWGISPLLLYAVATEESHWDQTGIGDYGRSSGVMQVADRGWNHAFPGFGGSGSMLARENTCFNADFYGAYIYATFHGLTGATWSGDIAAAVDSWCGCGGYVGPVFDILWNQTWITYLFNGVPVPY